MNTEIKSKRKTSYYCNKCKVESEDVLVVQLEKVFYRVNLKCDQWESYDADTDLVDQSLFCHNCNSLIPSKIEVL